MGLLARLLGRQGDDNAHVRPLWHAEQRIDFRQQARQRTAFAQHGKHA